MKDLMHRVEALSIEVGECWEWQGALQSNSPVPTMNYGGKVRAVRRHLAEALEMPIEGKLVTFKCGNPLCVQPKHLELTTRKKLQQRIAKHIKHHTNPVRMKKISDLARLNSKLTLPLALEIRNAEGKQREIAARYGVTQATVSSIKRGATWRDYSNPFAQLIGGLNK